MSVTDPVDWRLPRAGGCRCGALRFAISLPPLATFACHCRGCQQMSASAFSLTALVPEAGFSVVAGRPIRGGLRGDLEHFHCGECLTWTFTRPPGMGFVNVRAVLLDDPSRFRPYAETYTSERLPWATTPALRSFERFPPEAELPGLLEEFARLAREQGPWL